MRTAETLDIRRHGDITITYTAFFRASILYLILPVIIFFLGYLRPLWAVVFTGLTVVATIWVMRDIGRRTDGTAIGEAQKSVTIKPSYLLTVIPLILIVMYFGGVSEYGWCTIDHRIRYAILNDLIDYRWPVIYDLSTQQNPVVANALGEGHVAFAYYFVFWMIPAVAGKLFGMTVARLVLFIWTGIGLFLIAIGASLMYGKASKALFLGLMLFAGFDVIPYFMRQLQGVGSMWEDWTSNLRIVGNFYQIMNVFHQSVPGWLITIMLLLLVNSRSVGYLGALMFCYSPWAAIGILPMCVCKIAVELINNKKSRWARELFTIGNIITPIVFFICFAPFYTSNPNARNDSGFIWTFYASPLKFIEDYILYAFFEFGAWYLLIRKSHRKDPMLITALVTLLVFPIYKISYANDLLMRGSMAPMFLISLYAVMLVTDNFHEMMKKDCRKVKPRIMVLLLIASAYSTINLLLLSSLLSYQIVVKGDTENYVAYDIVSFGNIRDEQNLDVVQSQFFVNDYEDVIFFKYLARTD
ncbi:MAG: hypothetical protein IJ757_01675 [Clostridiales bacterium]|nr:hypothetical protein [Clostridiales bacterium]